MHTRRDSHTQLGAELRVETSVNSSIDWCGAGAGDKGHEEEGEHDDAASSSSSVGLHLREKRVSVVTEAPRSSRSCFRCSSLTTHTLTS